MSAGTNADDEIGARALTAVLQALHEASLDGTAGVWVNRRARGLHVLLAGSSTTDEETVRAPTPGSPR